MTNEPLFYPFTAIVDQEAMRAALVLNVVNPLIGGVLIRGPSGTAKSTAVRSFAALLPVLEVVSGCPFHCDPEDEAGLCGLCRARVTAGEELGRTYRPWPLVDLPLNATEDRVAGSLDITRALREGIRALEPGLLGEANRGFLYIDEINLLDDHIVDLLLDAAALGVNVVEREGLSVSHPARLLLVGTMNPEEGELRPQIADRIGLQVTIDALRDPTLRVEVMRRREAFAADAAAFVESYRPQQEQLREDIVRAIGLLPGVTVPAPIYQAIAGLSLRSQVPSHRADLTMLHCAKALAALAGRTTVGASDLLDAAELALGHRLAYDPFDSAPRIERRSLKREIEELLGEPVDDPKKAVSPGRPGPT